MPSMKCWNCGKPVPDQARSCQFCEVKLDPEDLVHQLANLREQLAREDLPEAERDRLLTLQREQEELAGKLMGLLDDDAKAELSQYLDQAQTAEEFANMIFVGECPACGSPKTECCEEVAGIESPVVGRCQKCAMLFCTECARVFENDKVTEAGIKCPKCGSAHTTVAAAEQEEFPEYEPVGQCHDCQHEYCAFCGAALANE